MLILSDPLLLLLLWAPNFIRLPNLERGDEGGYGSVGGRGPSCRGFHFLWDVH
jgi:hypothetical protein